MSVGRDIESICGKCGEVWHVVVAMVGSKIAKVQCKECGAEHRYRPVAGAKTKAAKKTTTRKTRKTRTSTATVQVPQVEADLSRPVRSYALSESYSAGDRIDHRTFGLGVVEGSIGRGKISVRFPDTRRVMAHEREA